MTKLKLTDEAFQRARRFMLEEARPLDRAKYLHAFEGGSAEAVLDEFRAFRNEDGGFGHALEPDMRSPLSSVLATSTAMQTFRAFGLGSEHDLVQGAMRFFESSYEPETKVFVFTPAGTDAHPHAPWWDEDGLRERFDRFEINPRAEILGYYFDYADLVPAERITEIYEAVLHLLMGIDQPLDINSVQVFQSLAETQALPNRVGIRAKVRKIAHQSVERDPAKWGEYNLKPLEMIHGPDSFLIEGLEDAVEAHLDYVIEHQEEDGSWHPSWSWFGRFDDDWPQAKKEWQGVITLETLLKLKHFGRLPT